jgi:steroid delta-isomerase-like uncharacterized protein
VAEQENKMLVRRFVEEVLNARALERLPEFLTSDYADGSAVGAGIEALRSEFENWFRSFPDHRITIEELVAEGDLVASRSMSHATHHGDYLGVAATGLGVSFAAHELYRIRDGKIAEHWEVWDEAALLRQIGGVVSADERGRA